jgi:hypothetical protein
MSHGGPHRGQSKKWRRIGLGLFVLLAVFLVFGLLSPSLFAPPFIDEPIPNPNGFEDIVRAGHMIIGQPPGPQYDFQKASADELRQWVDTNTEALKVAADGLKHKSQVVLPPSQKTMVSHMARMTKLRQLCRLKGAQARLGALEGRMDDAVAYSLETIQLAQNGTRGGFMIDALTGYASESSGTAVLVNNRDKLSGAQCREVIEALEAVDRQREPCERVAARERAWFRRSQNFFTQAVLAISPSANHLFAVSIRAFESSRRRTDARMHLLITELAIRRYRIEKDRNPPDLLALTAGYLANIPMDPFARSDAPLRYELKGDGHLLYSVGPDQQNDGGSPFPERSDWTKVRGDVLVDPK